MRTAALIWIAVTWLPLVLAAQEFPPLPRNETEIWERLRQPAEFDFDETPLSDVLDAILDQHGLQLQLNTRALDDEGVSSDAPVTLRVENISLDTGLRLILDPLGLSWIYRDNIVQVTTKTHAEVHTQLRLYPVGDLFERQGQLPSAISQSEFDELVNILTTAMIDCDWCWDTGSISRFHNTLVVSQSPQVHNICNRVLDDLRRVAKLKPGEEATPAERRLEKRLQRPVAWKFDKRPLPEVARAIEQDLGLAVQVNNRAIDDEGIATDLAITFTAEGRPALTALRQMLEPHGLSLSVVNHELLLIETHQAFASRLYPRVYNVLDLVADDPSVARFWDPTLDYKPLIDALTGTVLPADWKTRYGQPAVQPFRGRLVLTHHWQGHQRIEALLRELREAQLQVPAGNAATTAGGPRLIQRTYQCGYAELRLPLAVLMNGADTFDKPAGIEEQLAQAIPVQIAPSSWKSAGGRGSITGCHDEAGRVVAIVVWQTPDVQREIADLLRCIDLQLDEFNGQLPREYPRWRAHGPRLGTTPTRQP